MFKVALVVWLVLGSTLAGITVIVITTVPSLYAQGMTLIPWAAIIAAIVAIPLSFLVAKQMMATFKR